MVVVFAIRSNNMIAKGFVTKSTEKYDPSIHAATPLQQCMIEEQLIKIKQEPN